MRGTQFAQLTAFVAVAENRSFTKAASHLGITAPSAQPCHPIARRALRWCACSIAQPAAWALTDAGEQLSQSF